MKLQRPACRRAPPGSAASRNWQLDAQRSSSARRLRVEIPAPGTRGAEPPQPRGADHRRVVGRERERRNEHRDPVRARRAPPRRRAAGCSPTRRRRSRRSARRASAPPRTSDRAAPRRRRAGSWRRCRPPRGRQRRARRIGRAGFPVGPAPVRSRTSRSTAVFRPLKLKSIRRAMSAGRSPSAVAFGALRSACVNRAAGNAIARSLPPRASAIDDRAARISKPEQLRHLVVRLPRRIVARPADQLVVPRLGDEVEARVAARHDEHGGRQRQLAVRERERLDVAGEMMDRHDRNAAGPGERLRERDADEQRSDEPRPLRHRDGADRRRW